jgi:hypothetical protein
MSQLQNKTTNEYCAYMERVALDHEEAGHPATAEDYFEAIRRIEEMQDVLDEISKLAQEQAG